MTHDAMLVSYSMPDAVSSLKELQHLKKKKALSGNKLLKLLVNGVY